MSENLRWQRIVFSGALLAIGLCAVGALPIAMARWRDRQQAEAAKPRPLIATSAEQREILRLMLKEAGYATSLTDTAKIGVNAVLSSRFRAFCSAPNNEEQLVCPSTSGMEAMESANLATQIPRKLRMELVIANRVETTNPDPMVSGVVFLTQAPAIDTWSMGEEDWQQFRDSYPGATVYLEISRAVFTEDRSQALIYVSKKCGTFCGTGQIQLWRRDGATWRIVEKTGLWVS